MIIPNITDIYYFAHPYTTKDAEGRYVQAAECTMFDLCNQRSARLLEAGFNIYSPITHTHAIHMASRVFLQRHEHERWYELDNALIARVEWAGIIVAPGWTGSKGCRAEVELFEAMDLPVIEYASLELGG